MKQKQEQQKRINNQQKSKLVLKKGMLGKFVSKKQTLTKEKAKKKDSRNKKT